MHIKQATNALDLYLSVEECDCLNNFLRVVISNYLQAHNNIPAQMT